MGSYSSMVTTDMESNLINHFKEDYKSSYESRGDIVVYIRSLYGVL